MTKRLTIYAHSDAKGQVWRDVTRYLEELRALSDKLVFVSTAPLSEEEVDRLQLHADEVVLKDNVGLDFGMWKHVIDRHELSEYDELVLTNSSIIGPLRPLQPIFSRMASRTCDLWGMTENFDGEWHLQSYFLVLKKKVMRSEAFATFWSSVLPYRSRWQILRSYEVGFTVYLSEKGFKGEAAVPAAALFPEGPTKSLYLYQDSNATCYYPERLCDRGMLFVKVQLLRENPIGVPLRPVYARLTGAGYDASMVEFEPPVEKRSVRLNLYFKWLQRPLTGFIEWLFARGARPTNDRPTPRFQLAQLGSARLA